MNTKKDLYAELALVASTLLAAILMGLKTPSNIAAAVGVFFLIFSLLDTAIEHFHVHSKPIAAAALIGAAVLAVAFGSYFKNPSLPQQEAPAPSETVAAPVQQESPLYAEALRHYENKQYIEALRDLAQIGEDSLSYNDAQALLKTVKAQYLDQLLLTVEPYRKDENHLGALRLLSEGRQYLSDMPSFSKVWEEQHGGLLTSLGDATENASTAEELKPLVTTALNARDLLSEDQEILALGEQVFYEYRKAVFKQTDALLASEGFDKALEFISTADTILPNDASITEKLEEVLDHRPVPLDSLEVLNPGRDTCGPIYDSIEDTAGNVYMVHYTGIFSDEGAKYQLDGKYKTLTGVFAIHNNFSHVPGTNWLIISSEKGRLKTYQLERWDDPLYFSVDITGVEQLSIAVDSRTLGGYMAAFAANLELHK